MDGRYLHYRVDRYLKEFPEWVEWSGIRIVNWHRPLAAYMRELLALGLTLTYFDEPSPRSGDADQQRGYRRVPWFMVMEWRAAGGTGSNALNASGGGVVQPTLEVAASEARPATQEPIPKPSLKMRFKHHGFH